MSLVMSAAHLHTIYSHAEHIYPEECCGILLGKIDAESKLVVEVIATINTWEAAASVDNLNTSDDSNQTKHSRYTIDPRDIFAAQKRGRELQLQIVGFFHSHPNTAPIPSTCDRDRAWQVYSYPIVSVMQGKVNSMSSWVLDGEGSFQPETVQIVPSDRGY